MVDGSINNTPIGEEGEVEVSTSTNQDLETTTTSSHTPAPEVETQVQETETAEEEEDYHLLHYREKGYNLTRDILGIKKNPQTAHKVVSELENRTKADILPLVTITEANWEKNAPFAATIIRKEREKVVFKNSGLDFVLKNIILSMLPGEKGANFKKVMHEKSLEEILDDLERIVDKEGHPLVIGKQAFALGDCKHEIDDKSVAKLSNFLKTLKTFKTEDKKLIYLIQTTCNPMSGLSDGWEKEDSVSQFLQKVRLREVTSNRARESLLINNVNGKGGSTGKVGKNYKTKPKKSQEAVINDALRFLKKKLKLNEITADIKATVTKRIKAGTCPACGEKSHYYAFCKKVNLRQ